jgi:ABC-type branched-subunit amino acid transport system ATPase component/branched-subunit amino acid ABC-type transport system permease component
MAAVGLVLSYRTSGIFNLAHGALATLSAYVFWALHIAHDTLPWPIAALISVLLLGVAVGFGFERFARVLSRSSLIMQVVGTVGVLLIIEAGCTQWYGSNAAFYPAFLPESTVTIGSVHVTVADMIIFGVSIVATLLLYVLLRATRLGQAMRAVVDDPDLLAISGTSPVRVRRAAWVIGAFFAMLSGLLLAPSVGLDATALTLLVVQAFGAAAIGRFQSLPMTWVGGVIIGVAASLATKYLNSTSILSGLPTALPFIILFGALVVVRQRGRDDQAPRADSQQHGTRLPLRMQLPGAGAIVIFLVLVPWLFASDLTAWMTVMTDTMLFLSLGLLVRSSRQVSLCQITFAAIGAVAFSKLAALGIPWVPSLLLAGIIVVPIGALLAIPAVRLSGLYLALATLGFGLLVQAMFYQSNVMFGIEDLGLKMPRPTWFGLSSDKGFYFLLLAFAIATSGLVLWLIRGRLGGLLKVLGESPVSLEAFGVNITVTRIVVFCLSAFIAAIAGALSGCALGSVTGSNFDPLTSLTLMVVVVITVGGEPWYALLAAMLVVLLPTYLPSQTATDATQAAFGIGAVLFSLGIAPQLPGPLARLLERARTRPASAAATTGTATAGAQTPARTFEPVAQATLSAEHITVRFGGLVAVDDVSVSASTGRITGVIGPNGAGKTTLFNACSGLNTPTAGEIVLDGRTLSHDRPSVRARMGIGRTFQQVQLADSLSVRENVAIGAEAGLVGSSAFRHLIRRRAERDDVNARARESLELCGIAELSDRPVGDLSTGQRRLVELARCLAGAFKFLLLDEPSSGLDAEETEAFGKLLRRIVAERGLGILLIEHDLSLTMTVCDELYVLDFGRLIHEGTPESARAAESVQSAYLGDVVMQ